MSFTGKSYSQIQTATSRTVVEDSKKKTSLLKDNSWIKKNVEEDKPVDQDTNFGKSLLTRYKSNENLDSSTDTSSKTESKTTTVTTSGSSVQALSKRFGGSQDKLNETRTTTTRSTVKTQPKNSTSSTTTTVNDGVNVTETITTTRKDVVKSSTDSETNLSNKPGIKPKSSGEYKSEVTTVKSSKDIIDGPTSTVKTSRSTKTYTKEDVSPIKTTSYSIKSTKSTDDQLFDTLIPTSIKTANTKPNSSDYKSEVTTVKSSTDVGPTSSVKTTTSVKTFTTEDTLPSTKTSSYQSTKSQYKTEATTVRSSTDTTDGVKTYIKGDVPPTQKASYSIQSTNSTEDQLFDTLIPTSIRTSHSKSNSNREDQDVTSSKSIRTSYSSNDRHEWGSVTSPSYKTRTSYTETRPVDYLSDNITSKSSTTVYTSPERKVSEKDLCTSCRKNMYNEEKIILDEMNINCHASCFKCNVCNTSLGNLKAGDSLWVYRNAVHCENCFAVTKGKWHR